MYVVWRCGRGGVCRVEVWKGRCMSCGLGGEEVVGVQCGG